MDSLDFMPSSSPAVPEQTFGVFTLGRPDVVNALACLRRHAARASCIALLVLAWLGGAQATWAQPDGRQKVQQLIDEADRVFSAGQYSDALKLLTEASSQAQATLGPDDDLTLRARNDQAGTLYHLGRLSEARNSFESLLRDFERLGKQLDETALDALNNYANVLATQGLLAQALPLYQRAYDLRLRKDGESNISTISALGDLAWVEGQLGKLHESLSKSRQVLSLRQQHQGERHQWTFTAMNNLGFSLQQLGRQGEALTLHERTLALRRESLGESHAETLVSMNNVGTTLARVGRAEEALDFHLRAYRLQARLMGPSHFEALDSLQGVGNDLQSLAYHRAAEQVLRLVLERRLGAAADATAARHPRVATTRLALAEALAAQSAVPAALEQASQAVTDLSETLGPNHFQTLAAQVLQAQLLRRLGRTSEALDTLRTPHARAQAIYGAAWPTTLAAAIELARCLMVVQRWQDTVDLLVPAVQEIERVRAAQPQVDGPAQRAVLQDFQSAYRLRAAALARLGRNAEAFEALEAAKARHLLAQLGQQQAARAAAMPMAELAPLAQAQERFIGLTSLLGREKDPDQRAKLLQARQDTALHADTLQRGLRARYPAFDRAVSVPFASGSEASRLAPGHVLLSYLVDGDDHFGVLVAQSGRPVAWQPLRALAGLTDLVHVMRVWTAHLGQPGLQDEQGQPLVIWHWRQDGQPRWQLRAGGKACGASVADWLVPAPSSESVLAAQTEAQSLASLAACPPAHAKPVWGPHAYRALQQHLSQALLSPMSAHLAGRQQVLIAPDGPLGVLPWDALLLSGQTLARRHDVALLHSLSAHLAIGNGSGQEEAASAGARLGLLAIGNPQHAPSETPQLAAATSIPMRGARRAGVVRQNLLPWAIAQADGRIALGAGEWSGLPATQTEMARAAAAFAGRGGSLVVSGAQATETTLRQLAADGTLASADHVLFATHAVMDPVRPALSAIVLRREGEDADRDGYLTTGELAALRLRSKLVVLSACSTALSDAHGSDPLGGFAHALGLAGNRDALLTLWPMDDSLTALFVSRFMHRVAQGALPYQALAVTKRDFMAHPNPRMREPRHWAGFVLYPGAPLRAGAAKLARNMR